jgi:hypothetical protein
VFEEALAARFFCRVVGAGNEGTQIGLGLLRRGIFQGEKRQASHGKAIEGLEKKIATRGTVAEVELDVLLDAANRILREGSGMDNGGREIVEDQLGHGFDFVEARAVAFGPRLIVVKVRPQVRSLDELRQMIGGFHHRALHELDFGLLAGVLELTPGRFQLLARGPELPEEDGEIEQACDDEQAAGSGSDVR